MENKRAKITLKNLAKETNLSISTVARALKGESAVAEETREKVFSTAKKLGYEVKKSYLLGSYNNTSLVGLLISDIENMYFHSITRAIEDTISKTGRSLILCNTDENSGKEKDYIRVLLQHKVEGLIVAPSGNEIQMQNQIYQANIPLVILDRDIKYLYSADFVGVDNKTASSMAIDYLINLGHRRIAILVGIRHLITFQDRLQGYIDSLTKHKLPLDESLIIYAEERSIDGNIKAMTHFLNTVKKRPTAVFCTNNFVTLGVYHAVSRMGMKIPNDISVVGFDDMNFSEVLYPPLTALSQPTYAIGLTCAQLLLRRIEKKETVAAQKVIINAHLIERESCRPL